MTAAPHRSRDRRRPGLPLALLLLAPLSAYACGTPAVDAPGAGGAGGPNAGAGGSDGTGAGGFGGEPAVDERCGGEVSYEACGGALDGTWTVDHACGDRRVEVDQLYGGPTSFDCWIPADLAREVRGTVTYGGGRETADLSLRSRSRYTIPDVCAAALEPTLAPADFCTRFEARLPEGRVGGCVHGPAGCVCDYREARTLGHTRPYETVIDVIVEFPADPDAGFSYCVAGDRLVQSRGDLLLYLAR